MRSFKSFVACMLVASVGLATGCQSAPTTPAAGPSGAPPKPVAATTQPVAASPASAQTEIQGRYDAMTAAMKAKDPKGYLEVQHESFKEIDEKGQSTSRKDEAALKTFFEDMEKNKATMTIKVVDCQMKDNTATVNTEQVVVATIKEKKDPSKTHEVVAKAQTTDTWSKAPTGWKLMEQKVVKTSMTIDGKSPEEIQKSQAGDDKAPKAGKDTEDKGDKGEGAEKPADEKGEKGEKPEGGDKGE